MRGRRCAAAETGGPSSDSGTTPFESTANTGTAAWRASASAWAGTTKHGQSSVTTRQARAASRFSSPRPSPFRRSTNGQ